MTTRTLRIAVFCALVAAAALLAACGSSGGPGTTNGAQPHGESTRHGPQAAATHVVLTCLQSHGIHATRSTDGTIHASGSVSSQQLSQALGTCSRKSGVTIAHGSTDPGTQRKAAEKYVECLKHNGIDVSAIARTPTPKLAEAARKCSAARPQPLPTDAPAQIKIGKLKVGKIDLSHLKVKIGKIHIGKIHIEKLEKLGTGKSLETKTATTPAPAN